MKTFGRTSPRGAYVAACAVCLLLCALTTADSTHAQTRRRARQQKTRAQSAAVSVPMSLDELLKSLGTRGLKAAGLIKELEARGVNFRMTPEEEAQLVKAGAPREAIEAARSNYRPATQQDSARAESAPVVATTPKVVPLPVRQDTSAIPNDVPRPMPTPEASGGGGVGVGSGPGYGPGRGYNVGGGEGGEAEYSRPFRPGEVTRKAVITFKPAPGFTEEASKNGVEGTVRLRAILSASGSVQGISVVKSLPDGLTEKAIAAAKQIRFTPAQKDGRKVSQYVTLEYNFNFYYDEDEVTRRAVILKMPPPEYTDEARRKGVSGKVVLKVILSSSGSATVESVVHGLPDGLTEKAVEAAQRIKFTPAEKDGRAVAQVTTVEYDFKP